MIPHDRELQTTALINQARALDVQAAQQLTASPAALAWLASRKYGRGLDRQGRLEQAVLAAEEAGEPTGSAPELLRQAAELRWQVVLLHTAIAGKVARRYTRDGWDWREVLQQALLGVYEGAKRFDPARGLLFGTYVRWWARAQVTREMSGSGLSQLAQEQLRRLRQLEQHGPVSNEDAAPWLRTTAEGVAKLRESDRADQRHQLSIDVAVDDNGHTLADLVPDPAEPELEGRDIELALRALRGLPDRESLVLSLRFGLSGQAVTLADIGRRLGVSRERVRQLERQGLRGLREALGVGGAG